MAEPATTTATVAHPGTPAEAAHATYLGLDTYGWVAMSMLFVIVIFLWQKVPGAIAAALDKKIDAIRGQLAEAEDLRKEAEALKAEYAGKAAAAEKDAAAMVERARHEADAMLEKARKDADSMIKRRTRMAEEKIAAEQRDAVQQLRAAAADAATRAAAQLIAERVDGQADSALVDAAIKGLGK
jgi:F-type H+-transporting ATPase subunit b